MRDFIPHEDDARARARNFASDIFFGVTDTSASLTWLRQNRPSVLAAIECAVSEGRLLAETANWGLDHPLAAESLVELMAEDPLICSTPKRQIEAEGRLRSKVAKKVLEYRSDFSSLDVACLSERFSADPMVKVRFIRAALEQGYCRAEDLLSILTTDRELRRVADQWLADNK